MTCESYNKIEKINNDVEIVKIKIKEHEVNIEQMNTKMSGVLWMLVTIVIQLGAIILGVL